jgi:hypothetical protein
MIQTSSGEIFQSHSILCRVSVGPLVSVGRRWSALGGVGQHWATLVSIGRRWSALPWSALGGVDQHWAAMREWSQGPRVQCNAVEALAQCASAVQCSAVQCRRPPCVQCSALHCRPSPCVQCSAVQCRLALYAVQCRLSPCVQCSAVQALALCAVQCMQPSVLGHIYVDMPVRQMKFNYKWKC